MKKLTQAQYQTIFLYSKGLTFSEIDEVLAINSKGAYSQVSLKDKSRATRAKKSRVINQANYKYNLKQELKKVQYDNRHFKRQHSSNYYMKYCYKDLKITRTEIRKKYVNLCLDKSLSSYCKYKITFLKRIYKKVA